MTIHYISEPANQSVVEEPEKTVEVPPVLDPAEELRLAKEEAEKARKKAEELALFPLYSPSPLIRFDIDNHKLLYVNPAAFNKYSDIFAKGSSHPLLDGIQEPAARAFRERRTMTREVTIGAVTYLQEIAPHLLAQEKVVTVYSYDISRQKQVEDRLRKETERAEAASHAKSDFLANMSHELRTPMNGVLGMVSLLRDSKLDNEQRELVETIAKSGEQLLILLNDILDLSKIEANELTLEVTSFNFHLLIKDLIKLFEPLAKKKGIELTLNYSLATPDCVVGDPARIRQTLTNLLGNALKFTEKGYVKLDIASRRMAEGKIGIMARIEDTGVGIKEQHLEKIFNKFTQADETMTRRFGGTGLGLTICKLLVEAMGGSIGVESVFGRGSNFWFEIPLTAASAEQIERLTHTSNKEDKTMVAQAQTDFSSQRVLVVDDHPVNLFFARKLLLKFGFTVVDTAEDGKTALEMMKRGHYNVILLDCQMPEMDGYEVSRQIRAAEEGSGKRVPVIAMTANAMVGDREKCMMAGMDDYITKPINSDHMMEALVKWLGHTPPKTIEKLPTPQKGCSVKQLDASAYGAPVDMDHLSQYFSDAEEKSMVISLFMRVTEESLAVMEANAANEDGESWRRAAHKLKGSAANFGANYLKDCCLQAEQLSDASPIDKAQLLYMMQQAYDSVRGYLAV